MTKFVRGPVLLTVVLASVSVIGGAVLNGQKPGGGAVAVDFIAVNATGQHVADLQPADVAIKIAGKVRTVSALEFVKREGAGGTASASALPPPFGTNPPNTGRSVMLVVDNESLKVGTERALKEAIEVVLNGLGPSDRVAYSVAPRDTVQLGFSAGMPAIRAAVAKLAGIRSASVSDSDNACRSRDSLVLLRSLVESMAGSDSPTSVIYIGSGLVLPGSVNRNTAGSLSCEVQMEQYTSIAAAAASARVNLYVAQGDDTITSRDSGLENLAGVTSGGTVMRAVGNGLSRVVTESAGYYMATLQPDSTDRPGQVQRLELKVNREGVSTRARSEVAMIGRRAAGGKPPTAKEMVATTTAFTDLQLRVSAVASRGQGGKMTVLALAEPVDRATKLSAVSVAIFPVGGAKAAYATSADEKQLLGRPMAIPLAVDAGKYRLRVAATDATGRAGAVDYEVDANFTDAGPLKLGGLLIVGPRGEAFAPQLLFTDEPEVGLSIELFGDLSKVKIGAKIEIAATPDGKALVEGQPGGAGTSEPDKFVLSGKMPIAKLAPGDYIVRVIVQAEGSPEARVLKTIRKVAK